MDRKDVIRMAQEAELGQLLTGNGLPSMWYGRDLVQIKRFAALVAAAKQEECAKICDQRGQTLGSILAAAIRALT